MNPKLTCERRWREETNQHSSETLTDLFTVRKKAHPYSAATLLRHHERIFSAKKLIVAGYRRCAMHISRGLTCNTF
jgi:hypothetical protein